MKVGRNRYVLQTRNVEIDIVFQSLKVLPICLDSLKASGIFLVSTAYTVHTTMRKIGYVNAIIYDASMSVEQTKRLSSLVG